MIGLLLGPEIHELIREKNFAAMRDIFCEWPPADLADLVSTLPAEDQVIVFRVLPRGLAGSVFEYLSRERQKELLQGMAKEEVVNIVNEMAPDDRTALFEELPAQAVTELLRLLSPKERAVAQALLNYPPGSVGRLMTPDFVAIKDNWTIKQVLDHIRQNGQDSETLNVVYVVDEQGKLIDDVRIREFLLRPLDAKVADIRDQNFIALKVTDLEREAVPTFKKYDRTALPVVDSEGRLVGIVTIDDVLDVVEKEATVEIQKIGGTEALDEPYSTISFTRMVQKRATWLVMLFLGEMLTATAMGYFEDEIQRAVVLALFLPLIISSGGNSGSQASTLIIRAMALGEITLKDWWSVMRREIFAGLSLGGILAVIGFLRIGIWSLFSDVYGPHWVLVALTVALALIGVVLWGTLTGSMLPFLLRKCKIDPATSSAPFVATLVDVTGLIIYFTIALLVMRHSMLQGGVHAN
jgi:magnesium transporter